MASVFTLRRILDCLGLIFCLVCAVHVGAQSTEQTTPDDCPKVSVYGPAGVVQPSEIIAFVVSIKPEPTVELKFHWTTNAGTIIEGQSTRRIRIRYERELGTASTAAVKIEGLPAACATAASETIMTLVHGEPEIVATFAGSATSIDRKNLETAASVLDRFPNYKMYIIEYFPAGTSLKAIKRKQDMVMAFMTRTLKFDSSRITFVAAEAERPLTRIYRIPPGVSNPNP